MLLKDEALHNTRNQNLKHYTNKKFQLVCRISNLVKVSVWTKVDVHLCSWVEA